MNYWRTKDGRTIRITELTDNHLLNIIRKFKTLPCFDDIDEYNMRIPEGYTECILEAKARGLHE